MKGLSRDIELAIDTMIEGLEYDIDISSLDATKLKSLMKSKENSFKYAKDMINKWENSQNSPNKDKLKAYIERLVDAGDLAINTLRNFLREKVDYSQIDEDKHHLVTEGKSVIHQAIVNIDNNITDLRLQIEADKFNLSDKEFKRGYPEKFANQEFYPLKNYYKDWYDIDNDSIVIDPKGTRGKIINLDGLNITLPVPPPDEECLFHDLPKEEQYWRRTELPNGLTVETEDNYKDFILQEFKRRREGVWFFNNGDKVWLPPSFYFTLNWVKMKDNGDYMDFRYSQLDMAYHAEACEVDARCIGEIFVKSRRTGYTYEKVGRLLNTATSTNNANIGMTSKTSDDAQEAFSKLSYGYQNLPFFFRPVLKNNADSLKYLHFAKPTDRSKKSKLNKDTSTDDYLNTYLDYKATSDGSYDGYKMYRYLGDECLAKGTKVLMGDMSFKKIEDINIGDEVMVEGGKIMKVKKVSSGFDDMYIVKQNYGKDYVVNSNHKLYFEKGNGKENKEFIRITPVDFLKQSDFQKRITNRVTFSGVEFSEKDYIIDPYIMGCWLGDGYSHGFSIVVNHESDKEIIEEFKSFAEKKSLSFNIRKRTDNKKTSIITLGDIVNENGLYQTKKLNSELDKYNLRSKKIIPEIYKKGSLKQRFELLAGLIDTDGHTTKSSFNIGMANKDLIYDIYHLAKSCGLDTSEVKHNVSNFNSDVYTIRIMSDKRINCRIERKKTKIKGSYRSRRSRFSIEYKGVGQYYGFELDTDNLDDKRIILEDYTLTMNCSKWTNGVSFERHWGQISPTFNEGGSVVGKAFVGSTVAAQGKGGAEFHSLYKGSDINKRNKITGRTPSGLYSYFLPAHKNMREFTDKYGVCHEALPDGETFINVDGQVKNVGSIQYLEEVRKSKRKASEVAYNEELRAFPMTVQEAFRDEATTCLFNIEKINEQLDYIGQLNTLPVMEGNFFWKNGVQDTEVIWKESKNGHFRVTWLPPAELRNKYETKMGYGGYSKAPMNAHLGAFGCDSYDISGTVDGIGKYGKERENAGSKGALHGVTKFSIGEIPSNFFFLEYIEREDTADVFFENVLKACVFYGMPILVENNKPRLLYHFKNRGYRNFSITRFDKHQNMLSKAEREIGGMPNSSEDVKIMHATAIESYINENIGYDSENGDYHRMYFERTLRDWLGFDITKRTKFDATISSGLALMAKNIDKYRVKKQTAKTVTINIKRKSA